MKKVLNATIRMLSKITGRKNLERLLIYSAKSINVNLLQHGFIQIGGAGNFKQKINGERYFISKTLSLLFKTEANLMFFDIGANVGHYALELRRYFPNAEIHSFEPVKSTFDMLTKNTGEHQIHAHNIGFSDTIGTGELFNTVNSTDTEVASVYKDVFREIFNNDEEIVSIKFQMNTIDNFCGSNHISNIDFLKIDVEGHELSVLRGAKNMLLTNFIKVIQFEFNSHNVYSRVFLRDFYLLLVDFEFYRILHNGILKLGEYNPSNEIFIQQNIVAIRKDICHLIAPISLN